LYHTGWPTKLHHHGWQHNCPVIHYLLWAQDFIHPLMAYHFVDNVLTEELSFCLLSTANEKSQKHEEKKTYMATHFYTL